jgi:hypothetical protein
MQYVNRRNLVIWFAIIFAFYLVLTKIDLVVNYDLYQYGLQFDLRWAQPYWICLGLCFWLLAILSVASYWLESRDKNKFLCILIALTVMIPFYFGFEDVLWFLWRGQFPGVDVVWTWIWLNDFFPPWTTEKHLILATVGGILLASIWGLFLGKKWITFSFSYTRKYKLRKVKS